MTVKTYTGSCHCGAVKYEADLDLEKGTGKCNCTFCFKSRLWGMIIKPQAFRLLSGEAVLKDYQGHAQGPHHLFCSRCGVRSFERGFLEVIGGEYYTVNVACLDGVDPRALAAAPVNYYDGLNNAWQQRPEFTGHL
jgi:hypothetical protein